jgi:arsenite methyltransferase
MLCEAGFKDINVTVKPESADMVEGWMPGNNISDYVLSATIEAVKP